MSRAQLIYCIPVTMRRTHEQCACFKLDLSTIIDCEREKASYSFSFKPNHSLMKLRDNDYYLLKKLNHTMPSLQFKWAPFANWKSAYSPLNPWKLISHLGNRTAYLSDISQKKTAPQNPNQPQHRLI